MPEIDVKVNTDVKSKKVFWIVAAIVLVLLVIGAIIFYRRSDSYIMKKLDNRGILEVGTMQAYFNKIHGTNLRTDGITDQATVDAYKQYGKEYDKLN